MKNKNFFTKFLTLIFILCPAIILLTACGDNGKDKTLSSIKLAVGENMSSSNTFYIDKNYGETEGLLDIKISAEYSNGSNEEFSAKDYLKNITYQDGFNNTTNSTYESYKTRVENNDLTVGTWKLSFSFESLEATLYINVSPVESTKIYTLELTNLVPNQNLSANTILYHSNIGKGYAINIKHNDTLLDANAYEEYYYVLKDNNEYSPSKTAKEYYDNNQLEMVNSFDELTPNEYYVCGVIKAETNYNQTYTKFTKITVAKGLVYVDASNLTFNYTYSNKYTNASFLDMQNSYTGGSLCLYSDNDNTNNETIDNTNKLVREEIYGLEQLNQFGTIVDVNPNNTYLASKTPYTITLKFVPNEEYSAYLNESEPFEVKANVSAGTLENLPYVGNSFGLYNGSEYSNNVVSTTPIDIDLRYDKSLENVLFRIETNAIKQSRTNDYDKFYTNTAGNFYVKFVMLTQNFKYPQVNKTDNYAYTIENAEDNSYITFKWTIEKSTIDDIYQGNYILQSTDFEESAIPQFDTNGKVTIRLGYNNNDALFENSAISWQVMPIGTQDTDNASLTSTAIGTLTEDENHSGNNRYRILTINPDDIELDTDIKVAIKLTISENANFSSYEKIIVINIGKLYIPEENLPYSVYTSSTAGRHAYIIFEEGDTVQSILNRLDTTLGVWTCENAITDETISNPENELLLDGSMYRFVFTTNNIYINSTSFTCKALNHTPSDQDFE